MGLRARADKRGGRDLHGVRRGADSMLSAVSTLLTVVHTASFSAAKQNILSARIAGGMFCLYTWGKCLEFLFFCLHYQTGESFFCEVKVGRAFELVMCMRQGDVVLEVVPVWGLRVSFRG